ncbi:MAG TPA: sigma-54 dependent transcriptional regulator [Rectinemataceae bacterium]|nr:sigma-54 dependent transcriptional regulator [Rectinemataceae bacterium]
MSQTPYPEHPILLLDDDEGLRTRLGLLLADAGINNIVSTEDPDLAMRLVLGNEVTLVFLDLFLPKANGETLLEKFTAGSPQVPVIVVTGDAEPERIVRCMRAGAIDYLVKPVEKGRLLVSVWNGLAAVELRRELNGFRERVLEGTLERPETFADIVTADPRMLDVFRYIEAIASSRHSVLIQGETGAGKELFARAVHVASRRAGAFVAVNAAGLDDALFSDALFGHRKGAYTGADTARAGLIKEAAGGTLFLDEIGDLEPRSQVKLLRLLQDGEYYPSGSDIPLRSEARVVAATSRDLREAVRTGAMRSDLYFRLQTHPIRIPPLRERRGDIPLLVRHFVAKSAESLGMAAPRVPDALLATLAAYDFPGNVRELEALVHDEVARSRNGELDAATVRERLAKEEGASGLERVALPAEGQSELPIALLGETFPTMREAEKALVTLALRKASGNMSVAAGMLGISRQTLYKKVAEIDEM